jgi:PAS domain S-box-containing protein/putative nucleotidyltransferase with HDIG domain
MTVSVLLAVDDRPDNLFVLEQVVRTYLPEIKMITAGSAEAGLALAATEAIDGALIDVQMPGMNGIEMCRGLKADPRTASIHVILVTAHRAPSELKAQGLEAGANDFITKPIDNVELAAKLRVMLRLRAAEQGLCRERDHLEEAVRERTQALHDAEYRYRTLFQAAADPIFINDLDGIILEVNEEASRLLGYTREELLRLTVYKVIAPEYVARRPEFLEQLRAAGHLMFETELLTRDGRIIPAECSSRLMDLHGQPAVLSIARDISERQAAEAALRQSEERFRLVFEKAPIGIMHYDQTSTITKCNAKFSEIIGTPKEKFIGFNLIRQLRDEQMRKAVAAALDGQVGFYEGNYLSVTGGKLTPVRAIYQPIFSPEGSISGGITIFEDITERQRAVSELKLKEKLLDSASDSIFLHDLEGNFLYMNEAAYITRWYRQEELMGLGAWALATPEAAVYQDNILRELWANGELIFESEHRRKDGSVMPVEIFARVLAVEDREMILSIARDLTQRKQSEAALALHTIQVQALLDLHRLAQAPPEEILDFVLEAALTTTQSGYCWVGLVDEAESALTVQRWSKNVMQQCTVINQPIHFPVAEGGLWADCIRQRTAQLVNDYPAYHPGNKGLPEGHVLIRRVLIVPVLDGGRTVAIAAVANKGTNYTEDDMRAFTSLVNKMWELVRRQQSEEALHASEERYRAMITNTINAVALHEMLYDSQGRPSDYRFLLVNPAFEKLTGLDSGQVVGKTANQVFPGLEPFWIETYGQVVATGAPVFFERYEESLKRYFQVTAYKTQAHQFATIFSDITAAKQAAVDRLKAMTDSLQSLATAIEMRDPYTSGHQRRVTALAAAIAREIGLDEETIQGIELGGILHDVGKISVPAEILSKPGKISPIEFSIIKSHSESGYEILKNIAGPWPLSQMVLQHHERMDGSGYPQGLKGPDIIIEARILAVADVVEAMASHRPYRSALGIEKALDEIATNRGILYDAEVVDACVRLFREKHFNFEQKREGG